MSEDHSRTTTDKKPAGGRERDALIYGGWRRQYRGSNSFLGGAVACSSRSKSWKREYTDKYVVVDAARPELRRFFGMTGTVKTINMSGRARCSSTA
jgi:hypothetical protein